MADYQTLTLTNLSQECCIQIAAVKTGVEPCTVTKVVIKRKLHDASTWVSIGEMPITTVDDFTFTVKDFNTRSRYTYDYILIPCVGDTEGTGIQSTMKCDFYGIYLADNTKRFVCELNPRYDINARNTQVAYVLPLAAKYPYRIQNGLSDYATGSVKGLFLPRPSSGNYTQELSQDYTARDYKNQVMDFLAEGSTKVLKTYDGHIWTIGIDSNPNEPTGDADGASEITFNWTEIAAPPDTGIVVVT